jgi:hypothetical protein
MAILFPIQLRYKKEDGTFEGSGKRLFGLSVCRFLVNPTSISVKKTSSISETRTCGGTVFQSWPNMPDEVSFDGILYGIRSLQDFKVLQNSIDQLPHLKEVILQYKWREYHGYITSISVKAAADKPRVFEYDLSFKSKDAFSLTRMMLGQFTGYQAEIDYIKNSYYGIKNSFISDPIAAGINAAQALNPFGVVSILDTKTLTNIDTATNQVDITENNQVSKK